MVNTTNFDMDSIVSEQEGLFAGKIVCSWAMKEAFHRDGQRLLALLWFSELLKSMAIHDRR